MSKHKKETFFWASYSDLMTSLFFVMLVLFVLVIVLLSNRMRENINLLNDNVVLIAKLDGTISQLDSTLKTTKAQLDKILEIEESVKNIDRNYFEYNAEFKRHTLTNINVSFRARSSNINDIPDNERGRLLEAGRAIRNFVTEAARRNPEVKYLLIVEGQASKDNYLRNFELSYERALALRNYWMQNGLEFNTRNCEIIISGSGTESIFREYNEAYNQRFVIHVIPKIGEIEIVSN